MPRGAAFHETVVFAARHLSEAHLWVTLVGLATLVTGLVARRFAPRWPYMILAMMAGALLEAGLDRWLGNERTANLANAPEQQDGLFLVPRVIE